MNVYLFSDGHENHDEVGGVMLTYCLRPEDYSARVQKNWNSTVKPEDLVIHLGDVAIGSKGNGRVKAYLDSLNGRKVLVRGNHDRDKSVTWWMENGFDFASDGMMFRHAWLTHEPAFRLPPGAEVNVHGHLHNIWDGFTDEKRAARDRKVMGDDYLMRLKYPWQRLFALEYTDYRPVEFNKFIGKPEKYQATGPNAATIARRGTVK